MVEWAAWWDKTIERWESEGLDTTGLDYRDLQEYFGLDLLISLNGGPRSPDLPNPEFHGAPIIHDRETYDEIHRFLFNDSLIDRLLEDAEKIKPRHEKGEVIIRLWLDGFFWFPRTLFGIEQHLFAFYDQPDLMHRMNSELVEYNLRVVEKLFPVLKPG